MKVSSFLKRAAVVAVVVAAVFAAGGARAETCYCEYIEASGGAAVDTGYVASNNTVIAFKGMFLSTTSYGSLFQDYTSEQSVATRFILKNTDPKSFWVSCYTAAGGSCGFDNAATGLNTVITGLFNRATGTYVVNAQTKSYSQSTGTLTSKSVKLHASNCQTRLYYFTVVTNDVVVHDFRPYVKDDEAGYLDLVTGDFHGKVSGGTLTAGGEKWNAGRLTVTGVPVEGGTVTPAYGANDGYSVGESVACSASSVWTNDVDGVAGACAGYKVYTNGVVIASGTGNTFTYTHPDCPSGATLTWNWDASYKVTSAPEVTVSSDWVAAGSTVTLTAAVPEGKSLYRWVDSVSGKTYAGNPLKVAVTGVMDIRPEYGNAHYVATDGNDDTGEGTSAKPYATIAKALSVAAAKDAVIVRSGTYVVTAQSTISTAVTVRGATGNPEDVVIAASGKVRPFALNHAEATVEGVTLANGRPEGSGGAVYLDKNGGIVRNCVVTNCIANSWGGNGGAFFLNGSKALVENCVVSNCNCNANGNGAQTTAGGAIAAYMAAGTIRNSLFFHNGSTAGVSNNGCTIWLVGGLVENCTVVGNYYQYGSGIWATGGKVRNCLIYGNTSRDDQSGTETVWYGSAACFENCIAPIYINANCIVTNRFLRDFEHGDFTPAGAAIDAGVASDWQASATDVAGRVRVSGSRVDLGCYEVDQSVPDLDVDASVVHGIAPLEVVFTPKAFGLTGTQTFEWDLEGKDAWDVESAGAVTKTFAAGRWNVRARVKGTDVVLSSPIEIRSMPKTLYVDPDCETPTFPYGDMAHAATTLADAYAAAADGCEIVLAAKRHTVTATVYLQKAVTVRGETGVAGETVLATATSPAKRVVELQHPQAVLAAVAVTGGRGGTGGGSQLNLVGGTISNCVFFGNASTTWAGPGGAVWVQKGLVTHSVFSNNCCNASGNGTGWSGGGGLAVYQTGGTVRNSLFIRNVGTGQSNRGGAIYMTGGTLENCSFAKNKHSYGAGVRAEGSGCVVRNCLVGGNVCVDGSYEGHGEAWNGTASCFTKCLTDTEERINENCFVSSAPFVNLEAEDLNPCTAAVDTAAPQPWMTGATDLAGIARVMGDGPDIGCYEFDTSQFNAVVEADVSGGLTPLDVTFTVTAYGVGEKGLLCEWDWDGDGTYDDTSDGTTNHVFETGNYSVKYRITDLSSGKSVVSTSPITMTVVPKTLYVDGASTDPQEPYGDPDHAAKTVAAALAVALDGCEIVVAKNTYTFSSEILLERNIVVRGATGNPEDVVFKTAVSGIRLARLNAPRAAVLNVTMQGGNLTNNSSSNKKNGGGFYIGVNGGTVSNSIVRSCRTWVWGNEGDGFYIEEGATAALVTHTVVSNCVSSTSSTADSGNGATIKAGAVRNCLFAYNKVTRGDSSLTHAYGTVNISGGMLENCTIVKNTSFNCSGVVASGKAKVINCTIGLNTSELVGTYTNATVWAGTSSCFDHCLAPLGINNNCTVEAESVTYAAPDQGDFSLSGASKAVEGGVYSEWMKGATDFVGNDRVRGDAPDIGAYEADPYILSASVVADVTAGFAPLKVTFTVNPVNIEPENVRCRFAFDGGAFDDETVDGTNLVHTFTVPGDYPVRVRVEDKSDGRVYEIPGNVLVKVRPEILYVDPTCETPVFPFGSWEGAATNVQQALDAAIDGNVIQLKAGDQPVFKQLIVEKGVWIRGETGDPNETVLRNANPSAAGVRRVMILNHGGAKVSGLTVKDGKIDSNGSERSSHGGGIFIDVSGGMVSNCVIRNCYTWYHANYGGGMYIMPNSPALVTHCVFSNCHARTDGTNVRGLALYMAGGTVRNCLFRDQRNKVAGEGDAAVVNITGGTLESCTFASNLAVVCSGVWASGSGTKVRNCLIAGNETLSATASRCAWGGTALCFENCLTDTEEPINGTCLTASAEETYRDFARRDYRLPKDSPAVDAGIGQPWMTGATDLLGKPRVFGKKPDIGCCECQLGGLILIVR